MAQRCLVLGCLILASPAACDPSTDPEEEDPPREVFECPEPEEEPGGSYRFIPLPQVSGWARDPSFIAGDTLYYATDEELAQLDLGSETWDIRPLSGALEVASAARRVAAPDALYQVRRERAPEGSENYYESFIDRLDLKTATYESTLIPSELPNVNFESIHWTGTHLLLFGDSDEAGDHSRALLFEPSTGDFTRLPGYGPAVHSSDKRSSSYGGDFRAALWTNRRLFVFGDPSETATSWVRELSLSGVWTDLSRENTPAITNYPRLAEVRGGVLAWSTEIDDPELARYEWSSDSWEPIELRAGAYLPVGVVVDEQLVMVANGCAGMLYDLQADEWRTVAPFEARSFVHGRPLGEDVVYGPVTLDEVTQGFQILSLPERPSDPGVGGAGGAAAGSAGAGGEGS